MYKNKLTGILFILPMILIILIFLTYPFMVNVYDSLFKFNNATKERIEFVGLSNYTELISQDLFKNAIFNTFLLMVLVIVFQVGIALPLALLVNQVKNGQTFYKTSFFIPIIISASALGMMFLMFYRDNGAFNQLLSAFGKDPVVWLGADAPRFRVFFAVAIPVVWQYIGFYFVIFLTGLSTISGDLLEAAEIDGASSFQKIMYIQIPMLQNVTRSVLVLAITGTLKVFDLPFIINPNSEPIRTNFFLGTLMNRFSSLAKGNAAAFAVMLVLLGIILSGISNTVLKQNKDL